MNVWEYLDRNAKRETVINALDALCLNQDQHDEVLDALRRFAFKINYRSKSRFGCVKYNKVVNGKRVTYEVMELTSEYFDHGYILHDDRRKDHNQTLLHETAHIIVHVLYPRASSTHGVEWQRVMYALGANPTRCGKATFLAEARKAKRPATKKHQYSCEKCDYVYRCDRRLKNIEQRRHGDGCGGSFIHKQLR